MVRDDDARRPGLDSELGVFGAKNTLDDHGQRGRGADALHRREQQWTHVGCAPVEVCKRHPAGRAEVVAAVVLAHPRSTRHVDRDADRGAARRLCTGGECIDMLAPVVVELKLDGRCIRCLHDAFDRIRRQYCGGRNRADTCGGPSSRELAVWMGELLQPGRSDQHRAGDFAPENSGRGRYTRDIDEPPRGEQNELNASRFRRTARDEPAPSATNAATSGARIRVASAS